MLNFKRSGRGNQSLVLLHGVMESLDIWRDMLLDLEENFDVIRIDLPGHGKSPVLAEVQTMELMAEAVQEVLIDQNINEFHLFGHSMGGYVSLAYAQKHPQNLKSLTLFFSSYFADDEVKKNTRRKSFRIIMEEYGKYVGAGVPMLFNPWEREELQPQINFAKEIALQTPNEGALASVKGMIERRDKKAVLQNATYKVLVIAGRFDTAANADLVVGNLPDQENIKAYILDCGHQGHLEKPDICNAIIKTELL